METAEITTTTKKKLAVQIGTTCCLIPVAPNDNLFDVRSKVLNLPKGILLASWPEFSIALNEQTLSRQEELSTLAFAVIDEGGVVCLHEAAKACIKEKRVGETHGDKSEPPAKRQRPSDSSGDGKPKASETHSTEASSESKEDTAKVDVEETGTNEEETNADDEEVQILDVDKAATNVGKPEANEEAEMQLVDEEAEGNEVEVINVDQSAGEAIEHDEDQSAANGGATKKDEASETQNVDTPENPHAENDKVISQSKATLSQLYNLLNDPSNTLFCSKSARQDWSNEIEEALNKSPEDFVIGCLGPTGVGKSSLLNALLDEPDILPTSGSRGCTAAVVELRYNRDFLMPTENTVVYRGRVEFISLQEWLEELEVLLDDCCANGTEAMLAKAPDQEEANAAWTKIDQVYGKGAMDSFRNKPKAHVLEQLGQDERVVKLLKGTEGQPNTIVIEEGEVDQAKAKMLKERFATLPGKLLREKKKWAKAFRSQINDFVYRKGNGNVPQSWPLVRKVVLHGPWHVLRSGACLVDLPGVRDANVARAKVADTYIQKCDKIWIFCRIQRAVDDKTAKDLMGEQFKRQLLMDGKYGCVGIVCTLSDDCQSSEVMRDHEQVARNTGHWDDMIALQAKIDGVDKEKEAQLEEQQNQMEEIGEVKEVIKELQEESKSRKMFCPC